LSVQLGHRPRQSNRGGDSRPQTENDAEADGPAPLPLARPLPGPICIQRPRNLGRASQSSPVTSSWSSLPAALRALPPRILAWYDRHRRHLPWRMPPGEPSDPYRVWVSEIMLQQIRVETAKRYFDPFVDRWPTVEALAAAPLEEVLRAWAGLGRYARAHNLHACARILVERHGGRFPEDEAVLAAMPGIGPYTAAAIAAIAFGRK